MRKKKVDPIISEHFRRLQKKSWEVRRKKLLEKARKEQKVEHIKQ